MNNTDFTLRVLGETFQLKVAGASDTVVWTSGDEAVATVNAVGVVKGVGHGKTTITATVGGKTAESIVRCSF